MSTESLIILLLFICVENEYIEKNAIQNIEEEISETNKSYASKTPNGTAASD
jgi:hypothetical protein